MIVHGVIMDVGDGVIGILSMIIIWIGLFIFAKQAPKFIKQVLGIKEEGGKLFSGFGEIAAIGAAGFGAVGAAATNLRAARDENKAFEEERREKYKRENGGSDAGYKPHTLRNNGRAIASLIAGGVGGLATGAKAYASKDANAQSIRQAYAQRNSTRAQHSTLPGRLLDTAYGTFTGRSLADKASDTGEYGKTAFSTLKSWKDSVKQEAIKNGGTIGSFQLADGSTLSGVRYSQVKAAKDAGADQNGQIKIGSQHYDASLFGDDVMDQIADEQVRAWQSGSVTTGGKTYSYVTTDQGGKLYSDHERVIKAVNDAEIDVHGKKGQVLVDSYNDLGAAMGVANRAHQASQTDMKQRMRIANKQNKK